MAEPGFLRGREWYKKPKVQGRGRKRVKQMKRAWWRVWRADVVLVDVPYGDWIEQEIIVKNAPEEFRKKLEAWKWVI